MKLIYIHLGGGIKPSSVQNKICNQVQELNKNGIEAIAWLFSNEVETDIIISDNIILKPLEKYTKHYRFFDKYFKNNFYYGQVLENLEIENFDVLFVRIGKPCANLFKLLKKHSSKTYVYIPSNTISENFQEMKSNHFVSSFSKLFSWIEYFVFSYILYNWLYIRILPILRGTILFTPEFAEMIRRKTLGRAKTFYNRDGADCTNVPIRTPKVSDQSVYKLIFLKGSSMQQPWSGLNRLLESIKQRPDLNFQLYVTGKVFDVDNYQHPFIKLTGRLNDDDLNELINEVDLGVSNLANYMIHFSETTNLKSRDYFARGLPFIQSNTMPDVEGTIGENYYLNIKNDSSLINMDEVKDFIDKMRSDNMHHITMRKFAENHLNWTKTVMELSMIIKSN
jgi:hypothetical protein